MKTKMTIFVILFWMCGFGHASQSKVMDSKMLSLALGELDAKQINKFAQYYSDDIYFSDPEAQIKGRENLVKYFSHMLAVIGINKTTINRVISDDKGLVVFWTSYIYFESNKEEEYEYQMVSELQLDEQGLIKERRDYFDRMVTYQKIPGFIEDAGARLEQYLVSKTKGDKK